MLSAASASAASDSMTDMRHEEMVITLLRHCQSMKRQETHLRLATGFVVLMGFAVIFFLHYQKHSSATNEPGVMPQMEPLAQAQSNPKTAFHLTPAIGNAPHNTTPMQWKNKSGTTITSQRIETGGLYYIYLGMAYRIPDDFCHRESSPVVLTAKVMLSSRSYPTAQQVVISKDTMNCSYPNQKTVYMGRLIQLHEDDKITVMVHTEPVVIDWYTKNGIYFGAFLP